MAKDMEDDDVMDFGMGAGDEVVKKAAKAYKIKDNESDRITFGWASVQEEVPGGKPKWNDDLAWTPEGIAEEARIRWAACERVYMKGVGQVRWNDSLAKAFPSEKPKQALGTILVVWPTDSEGELDETRYKAGKGWSVVPWIHQDAEKYENLKKQNRRNPLTQKDVLFTCPANGGEFQKMTFQPEDSNLLQRYLTSKDENLRAVGRKIVAEIRKLSEQLPDMIAKRYTVDEIEDKREGGEGGSSNSGSKKKSNKEIDNLLDED